MTRNDCTCAASAPQSEGNSARGCGWLTTHRGYARMAGLMRYRGFQNEARMAVHFGNVETLVTVIRRVFDDHNTMAGDGVMGLDFAVEEPLRRFAFEQRDRRPEDFSRRHAQLIGLILRAALAALRVRCREADGSPSEAPAVDGDFFRTTQREKSDG